VFLDAKTEAGQNRTVPIVDRLAVLLADHRVLTNHPEFGLLFPGAWDADRPISPGGLRNRAADAWRELGLTPLGFHEGRHTFASLMIAAGINAKALSTYMGHANISITLDRYGHLMPGNEAEARTLLDAYLDRGRLIAMSAHSHRRSHGTQKVPSSRPFPARCAVGHTAAP
jgi:integrase